MSNEFFPKMLSVSLGSSIHTDMLYDQALIFDEFGFN